MLVESQEQSHRCKQQCKFRNRIQSSCDTRIHTHTHTTGLKRNNVQYEKQKVFFFNVVSGRGHSGKPWLRLFPALKFQTYSCTDM